MKDTKEDMKTLIETLYPMNRGLLGEGFDSALEYLKHLIGLDVIEIPSGTKFGTWTVPDEWIVRDAWVKFNGEKIIDYKKDPLSLCVGSLPFQGKVTLEELRKHWTYSDDMPNAVPYDFKFYDKDWAFCVRKNDVKISNETKIPSEGIKLEDGSDFIPDTLDKLSEGEYEVFIDTEYKPGTMKIGIHTVPGKSDREVLLFAHLDHPFQANDNLSAVACLVDVAKKIKVDHTVRIVFCAETIGSIAYAYTQDLSKVDFMIAVDICGNDGSLLVQKSWDMEDRLNRASHLAIQGMGQTYRKGMFRNVIGSDEYVFNDPQIGIPGIMLSRYPYPEYHTDADTPDKIDYTKIEETARAVISIVEIWEQDYIPKRLVNGPLMRSRYKIQTPSKQFNLSWDYFWYAIDGKRTLVELCCDYGLNFSFTKDIMDQMIQDETISRTNLSKGKLKKVKK